ncbi:venom acid phosphatase Acph-1 [Diachasma alloeum]|uniref:venom acid phosphatase Acph-1 n=1 Tax=Diachasma alloeum TaxID=454923 RepID=UPI0007382CAE|nr:venom acid phosphatase Acph-1 [Diachasma alloeum]XP_015117681.1 venom acid phosphatase Acph-1 [Diachasma alloeum]XP_015117682.1 venom acid phosphatase Acph-1 [Diachasma alloeum]
MTAVLQAFLLQVISLIAVRAAPVFDLKYVTAVFRHGARAPDTNGAERFPNDPYLHDDFFPQGVGGLTNDGKKREYELGQLIRTLYGGLLGDIYFPSSVVARSTDYERTKMSLQLVLAGIFPPVKAQQWNPNLNWQPMIANYVPSNEDVLMIPEECPQYLEEFQRVKKLPEVQERLNEFSGLLKNLSDWTGKNMSIPNDMFNLYHALMSESSMGLALPQWANHIFPEGLLLNGTILEYDIVSYNEKLKRLNGGMLLKYITETMESVINGANKRKISLLSGHETNVAALLKTLGIYYPHVPEYSSAIFVELLDGGGEYYVRVRYYLGIPPRVIEKAIPGCDSPCPLAEFMNLLAGVIPTDEDMVCPRKK